MIPRCRLSLKTSLYTWGRKAWISWCQGALAHETRILGANGAVDPGLSYYSYWGKLWGFCCQTLHLSENVSAHFPPVSFGGLRIFRVGPVGLVWPRPFQCQHQTSKPLGLWDVYLGAILVANWRITAPSNQGWRIRWLYMTIVSWFQESCSHPLGHTASVS